MLLQWRRERDRKKAWDQAEEKIKKLSTWHNHKLQAATLLYNIWYKKLFKICFLLLPISCPSTSDSHWYPPPHFPFPRTLSLSPNSLCYSIWIFLKQARQLDNGTTCYVRWNRWRWVRELKPKYRWEILLAGPIAILNYMLLTFIYPHEVATLKNWINALA